MAVSSFAGVMKEIEAEAAQAAAPAAPPVPAAAPAAPPPAAPPVAEAPKAPDVSRGTEPATGAPAAPPADATAAERKKWKLKGKVDGQEKEWEVGEDDFDEAKSPEGYKRLVEVHQLAEDYRRPGGALDQRAARIAQERAQAWMIEQGFHIKQADGKIVENPLVPGWREYVAAKAKGQAPQAPAAPAPQQVAPSAPELSPRQKRMVELKTQALKPREQGGGLDAAELFEYQDLAAEEAAERTVTSRETAREKASREAQERAAAEATQQQTAAARLTAEQQANHEFWTNHLAGAVQANNEKFRDPLTGQIDDEALANVRARWELKARETRDPVVARALFDQLAASHAAKLKAIVDKSIRVPTAPPPAPVTRGSAGGPATDDEDTFDYSKGFAKQGGRLAAWEKANAGASG